MLLRTLFTNNPAFFDPAFSVSTAALYAFVTDSRNGITVEAVRGAAHEVLCAARDKVHVGWRLLNHPLYGNYRPYQQPLRSLLLAAPAAGAQPAVDAESLHLLEQAFAVYASCADRWATPDNVPTEMLQDCAVIDTELMRASLDSRA